MVARRTPEPEFVDERSSADLELRDVVVLEDFVTAAVDAHPIALLDDAPLTGTGMTMAAGRVDRSTLGVVDQRPEERCRREVLDDARRKRCAVVERAAVAPDVDDELGDPPPGAAGEQPVEPSSHRAG